MPLEDAEHTRSEASLMFAVLRPGHHDYSFPSFKLTEGEARCQTVMDLQQFVDDS